MTNITEDYMQRSINAARREAQSAVNAATHGSVPADTIVQAVQSDLAARSHLGIVKYGVTLDCAGLDLRAWLQHAYEECLDQANYLKCAIVALDGGKK